MLGGRKLLRPAFQTRATAACLAVGQSVMLTTAHSADTRRRARPACVLMIGSPRCFPRIGPQCRRDRRRRAGPPTALRPKWPHRREWAGAVWHPAMSSPELFWPPWPTRGPASVFGSSGDYRDPGSDSLARPALTPRESAGPAWRIPWTHMLRARPGKRRPVALSPARTAPTRAQPRCGPDPERMAARTNYRILDRLGCHGTSKWRCWMWRSTILSPEASSPASRPRTAIGQCRDDLRPCRPMSDPGGFGLMAPSGVDDWRGPSCCAISCRESGARAAIACIAVGDAVAIRLGPSSQ